MTFLARDRAEAIGIYEQLGASELCDLTPFHCAEVVKGRPLRRFEDHGTELVGSSGAEITTIDHGKAALHILMDGDATKALQAAALTDHMSIRPTAGHLRLLESGLRDLSSLCPEAYATVSDFLSLIIFVKPLPDARHLFSSTSFYELPHCAFFTSAVFRHIAPDFIFPAASVYAVQENLYHEALHQKLIVSWRTRPALVTGAVTDAARVFVPWRQTHWQIEHALQAAYVYANVARLRQTALDHGYSAADAEILRLAAAQARQAAALLKDGILACEQTLTSDGLALVAQF